MLQLNNLCTVVSARAESSKQVVYLVLDRVFYDELDDSDWSSLSQTMDTIHGLVFDRWIPLHSSVMLHVRKLTHP